MTKPINNGGPAFPRSGMHDSGTGISECGFPGMTLRDWFAGQALIGDLASQSVEVGIYGVNSYGWQKNAASNAYILADAMLAARKKPPHD